MRRLVAAAAGGLGAVLVVVQAGVNGGFVVAGLGLLVIGGVLWVAKPSPGPASATDELAERRRLREERRQQRREAP